LSEPGARVAYEATPLNVHRRHAGSVTHALDGERHANEIAACQSFVRDTVSGLTEVHRRAQKLYLQEVRDQLIPSGAKMQAEGENAGGAPG
jgi:hypothetical protein